MQNNKNTTKIWTINIIKIEKYIMYVKNMLTGFMKASMIPSSFFSLWKFKYN